MAAQRRPVRIWRAERTGPGIGKRGGCEPQAASLQQDGKEKQKGWSAGAVVSVPG